MKRFLVVFAIFFAFSTAVMAQARAAVPPTLPAAPQFISFNVGAVIGYDVGESENAAGYNFGIDFAILDELTVGADFLRFATNTPAPIPHEFNGLRVAYNFSPQVGAALELGSLDNDAAVGFGVFATLFQSRGASNVSHALKIRVDYLGRTSDFGDGALLFGVGFNFGV